MAKNIAARRAAKAQRRKTVVAQKRRLEIETNSIAGQVRLATATPIQHCLVSGGLFGVGAGTLVLTRGATPYNVTMAAFLLDTFGPGVKDVFLRSLGEYEFAAYLDRMSITAPMVPVDPAYARKMLHDLANWSRGQGFEPHPDYARIEPLFGSANIAGCDTEFEFGQDGKPVLLEALDGTWEPIEFEIVDDDDTIEGEVVDGPEARVLEDAAYTAPHAEAD